MKKASLILIALLGFLLVFSGCKKEPKPFPYPMKYLQQHWWVTHVYKEGRGWIRAEQEGIILKTFKFKGNGVYFEVHNSREEKGIYKIDGNTLIGYVEGLETIRIEFVSMSATQCEMKYENIADGYTDRYRCEI